MLVCLSLSYIIVQSKHDDLQRLFLLLSLVFLLLHCPQFLNLPFSQQKQEVRSALESKKEELNGLKGKGKLNNVISKQSLPKRLHHPQSSRGLLGHLGRASLHLLFLQTYPSMCYFRHSLVLFPLYSSALVCFCLFVPKKRKDMLVPPSPTYTA